MISSTQPTGSSGSFDDRPAQGDTALGAAQRAGDEAISNLSQKVHDIRDQAAPVISRVAAKAEELARRSADAVRDRGQQVREQAYRAQDVTVHYIKDEPVKSILLAAAAGAALMALVQLLRDRD